MIQQEMEKVLDQIKKAESRCRRTEAQWIAAKEDAKAKKEEYEAALMNLREVASEIDQPALPFVANAKVTGGVS